MCHGRGRCVFDCRYIRIAVIQMIRTEKSPARDAGLLALRLGVGGVLFAHGAQKLFGWFGGRGIKGEAGVFEQMGFRPARASAVAAGLGETAAGSLIVLGLATPVAGSIAAGTMVAAASVHTPSGFSRRAAGTSIPLCLGFRPRRFPSRDPATGRWTRCSATGSTGPGWQLSACWRRSRRHWPSCGSATRRFQPKAVLVRYRPRRKLRRRPLPHRVLPRRSRVRRRGTCAAGTAGLPGPGRPVRSPIDRVVAADEVERSVPRAAFPGGPPRPRHLPYSDRAHPRLLWVRQVAGRAAGAWGRRPSPSRRGRAALSRRH
jgi:putative oxidoreductase